MKPLIAPLLACMIASVAFAQQAPPPPAQPADQNGQPGKAPPPPPPSRMMRGGMMNGGMMRGHMMNGCCKPGGKMGRQPGSRQMSGRMHRAEMLRGYLDLVERFTRLAENPTSAGVAAVVTAGDILKARGNDAAIDYFNKILPDVKDPAVQRAVHLQLAHCYKDAGESDKALDQLHMLMTEQASAAQPAPPKAQ